ncbi:integrase core domain-containing protein [Streptomyces sp. NPDC056696]|uniref:integrase core domain-containing protein n=1 Tax=unclassified Streptomyces TaxID=2593676 RepID=UPI0036825363
MTAPASTPTPSTPSSPAPACAPSKARPRPRKRTHCVRFNGTLRRELPDRTLILNERHLSRTLTKCLEHYNGHRPHRALNQLCPSQAEAGPPRPTDLADHHVHHTAVLGGLINEYQTAS